MKLPEHFIIHGHRINVYQKEIDLEDNRYGYYDSVREEIVIFHKLKTEGEVVTLSQDQIEHSFWHEVIHAFQWHIKGTTDEWEAQSYAGLIIEFLKTSGLKIDLDIVCETINNAYDDRNI